MDRSIPEDLKKLLINILPLGFYLEQISLLIITKGISQIQTPTDYLMFAYYAYIALVYGGQIAKFLITRYVKGYKRGFWIHAVTTFSLPVHVILVLSALYSENQGVVYWYIWQLVIFLILWGSIIIARGLFVLLVIVQVLSKKPGLVQMKQTYWLSLTTKQQLFDNKGGLIHDPWQDQKSSQSLISTSGSNPNLNYKNNNNKVF